MRGAKKYYLALVHVTITFLGVILLALVFMHRRTILVDYSSGALRQQTSIGSFILTEQTLPITGFEVIPYEYTSTEVQLGPDYHKAFSYSLFSTRSPYYEGSEVLATMVNIASMNNVANNDLAVEAKKRYLNNLRRTSALEASRQINDFIFNMVQQEETESGPVSVE